MGRLWRRELASDRWGQGRDEPIVMVEVVNSTPEPDGTRKTYFLHPAPGLRPMRTLGDGTVEVFGDVQEMTCHNAVASTFGRYGHQYGPVIQT